MSDRDNSTFRMIPPMRETVQVTFHRLVRVKPDPVYGERGGMKLVLRTVMSVREQREFVIDVPPAMEGEVTVAVKFFINQRLTLKSLMDDLLPVSGVMFRGVILWRSMLDEELMTDAYTLSIEGEEQTFPIRNIVTGVLLALLKGRPVQIERRLLEEQPIIHRTPNEQNEMSFRDRYKDYSDHIVERHIRQGLGTQLYREGELEETFDLIGSARLRELLDLAVSVESFEWAKIISDYLKAHQEEPEEPGNDNEGQRNSEGE